MTGPPDLADLTFTPDTILKVQSVHTNGSRILKEGVEFQYSSKRFPIIRTRLTVNGAWFRTTYNSRYTNAPLSLSTVDKSDT